MLESIPLALLNEWAEYNSITPFTAARDDWRAGMIVAKINNIFGGDAKPSDFLLEHVPVTRKSDEEIGAKLAMWAARQEKRHG